MRLRQDALGGNGSVGSEEAPEAGWRCSVLPRRKKNCTPWPPLVPGAPAPSEVSHLVALLAIIAAQPCQASSSPQTVW